MIQCVLFVVISVGSKVSSTTRHCRHHRSRQLQTTPQTAQASLPISASDTVDDKSINVKLMISRSTSYGGASTISVIITPHQTWINAATVEEVGLGHYIVSPQHLSGLFTQRLLGSSFQFASDIARITLRDCFQTLNRDKGLGLLVSNYN